MHERSDVFSNIKMIWSARIPLVKFCYLPTMVLCDLVFEYNLGVYKTQFLKFWRSFDDRVKPLMILLKYWAGAYGITGKKDKICNYALMCVIIFYLQRIRILPTIIELRKDCVPVIVNGWQVNFNKDYKLAKSSSNEDLNIVDLLYGFFKFVADIFPSCNFTEYKILSLLDGKVYSIEKFDNIQQLPRYMNSYKQYVKRGGRKFNVKEIVSIQDPIELNQNVMIANSYYALQDFRIRCRDAAYLVEECKSTNYKYLLKRLLSNARKPLRLKEKIYIKSYFNIGLPANFHTRKDISNKQQFKKDNTYYIIFNLLKDILEMILMCKVNINNIEIDKDEDLFPYVLSERVVKNNEEISIHCKAKKPVWKNREEHYHILLDKRLSRLEQEAIISERIMKKLLNEGDKEDLLLTFTFTACKAPYSHAINMTLCADDDPRIILQEFDSILYCWIPKIIKMTMEHMLQYNKTYTQLYYHKKRRNQKIEQEYYKTNLNKSCMYM